MTANGKADVGIIGGTGLGDVLINEAGGEPREISTPYGKPSSVPLLADWEGVRVAFIARHGPHHLYPPSAVPYRANIWAMKSLGVTSIIASGATGSLREEFEPGHLVICDQVIDKTFRRDATFFEHNVAVHVELADPFCPHLRQVLTSTPSTDLHVHQQGTYVCMEGPQFSTRAESRMHRAWGGDLIGMTCMPEAKLAREAQICYALVALPTDYDCWRPHDPGQSATELLTEILGNLRQATENAIALIRAAVGRIGRQRSCTCRDALRLAVWSPPDKLDPQVRATLEALGYRPGTS